MAFKLTSLLPRSPFPRINELMEAAQRCTLIIPDIVEALIAEDQAQITTLAKKASKLEGEADRVKDSTRAKMPSGLFLTVDRRDLLRLISEVDAIADATEDLGVLLTMRPLTVPADMEALLRLFVERVMETVETAVELVNETGDLLETGFGGKPAERADQLIRELGRREHEADKLQDQCAKLLFKHEDDLSPVAIFQWTKILNRIGDVANHAENVGDQYRLFLAN